MALRVRRGFSLIELLVAVVLVDIALLSMVAGGAVVVRRQTETHTRRAALQVAANRLRVLEAGPCVPSAGSTTDAFGIVEQWRSYIVAGGMVLRDSVSFPVGTSRASIVISSRVIQC